MFHCAVATDGLTVPVMLLVALLTPAMALRSLGPTTAMV